MTRIRKQFVIFLTGLALCMAGHANADPKITFVVEEDCPYSCRSEKEMGLDGFVQDILRTIFESHGYSVEFVIVPWLRALDMFNRRAPGINGMLGMKTHPINKEIALFPDEELTRYIHRFYALKDSPSVDGWKYQGVDSLQRLKIGCVKGWNYSDKSITKYFSEGAHPFVQALHGDGHQERNYQKLLAGRIDLWAANIYNAEYLISKKRSAGDKKVESMVALFDFPITQDVSVYPVFYRNDEGRKLLELYASGIRKLRNTGRLEKFLGRYGLVGRKVNDQTE